MLGLRIEEEVDSIELTPSKDQWNVRTTQSQQCIIRQIEKNRWEIVEGTRKGRKVQGLEVAGIWNQKNPEKLDLYRDTPAQMLGHHTAVMEYQRAIWAAAQNADTHTQPMACD